MPFPHPQFQPPFVFFLISSSPPPSLDGWPDAASVSSTTTSTAPWSGELPSEPRPRQTNNLGNRQREGQQKPKQEVEDLKGKRNNISLKGNLWWIRKNRLRSLALTVNR
jgi:hypothetical protein